MIICLRCALSGLLTPLDVLEYPGIGTQYHCPDCRAWTWQGAR